AGNYTFTATDLKIVANEKDKTIPGKPSTVWSGSVDLDGTTTPGSVDVKLSDKKVGDRVVITYGTTEGFTGTPDIEVYAGEKKVSAAKSAGTLTFDLDDDTVGGFTIKGNGVTVSEVEVTSVTTTDLATPYPLTNVSAQTISFKNGVVGDTVVITFAETADFDTGANGALEAVAVTDSNGNTLDDTDSSTTTYTFTLTEDSTSSFKVSGNGYTVSKITLNHAAETADVTPAEGTALAGVTTPGSVTVESTALAAAAEDGVITVTYAANSDTTGSVVIKANETEIGTLTAETDKTTCSVTLTAEQAELVAANGITVTGSGVTVSEIKYTTPETTTPGSEVTLLDTTTKTWTQTYADDAWTGAADIATTAITDNIGTIAAFKENYDNITATWTELTCEKEDAPEPTTYTLPYENETGIVLDGATTIDFDPYTNAIMKAGNKIEVKYSGKGNNAYVTLLDKDGTEKGRTTLQSWDGAEGTVSFILTDETIAVLNKGFKISGNGLTVKGVAFVPYIRCAYIDNNTADYGISDLEGVVEAEITFNVTTCDKNAYSNITFSINDGTYDKYIYASPKMAAADWFNANLEGTGNVTVKLPLVISGTDFYQIAVETQDYTAIDGELVRIKFLNADGGVVKTYGTPEGGKDPEPVPTEHVVLFEGSTDMGTAWGVSETIPAFAAKKGGKITATFTEGSAKDGNGNLYWQIAFKDSSWDAFPSSKPNQWGSVELSAGATSYSFTLDATDAASITSGGMIIAGYNVTVTKVTYTAPADPEPVDAVYGVFDGTTTTACATWADAIKAITDKTKDYTITVNETTEEGKISFPAASKAKSVKVVGADAGVTLTTTATSLTIPTDVTFENILVETSDSKGLKISGSKSVTLNGFGSKTITSLSAKNTLTISAINDDIAVVNYAITGAAVLDIKGSVKFANTVKATKLVLEDGSGIGVDDKAVTFTTIEAKKYTVIGYKTNKFVPITVTGAVTAEGSISIETMDNSDFADGQTVLKAKTADLSKFVLYEKSLPTSKLGFTLARDGSDVKVMKTVFAVYFGDTSSVTPVTSFAQWSDVLNFIADNAKNGNKDEDYIVELLADVNIGKFTMPKAGTFGSLGIGFSEKPYTLTFTGTTVSLTGDTFLYNLILKAEKTAGSGNYVDFSISAGKNYFELFEVTSKIKDIKSTGEVSLSGTTINGNVSANDLYIYDGTEPTIPGIKAAPNAFEPQAIDKTSVTVNGNLTVKNMLYLGGSLTVKGAFSAAGITRGADEDEIALVLTQNTKKPAVIGKLGFDSRSEHIKFALVDPTTGKTVQIVNDTVIASISGPYADQLVPCDENLAEDESYYIVKENGKLVAKPEDAVDSGYITVLINGKKARYKNLDEAIKDINATGKATDIIEFNITQAMFSEPIAKLPLPNAGKYGWLTYTADEDVTINVTSDLALTGNLTVDTGITINKVTVNKTTKETTVVPISVNVGKYEMFADCLLSPKTVGDTTVSQIVNISGAGTFDTSVDAVVTGKVNVGSLNFYGNTVTLEGTKSSLTASVYVHDDRVGTLVYDKANAKNVKFGDVSGDHLTVKINGEVAEGDAIAYITGDYTVEMIEIEDSELVVARSDKNLVAVSEASGGIVVIEHENDEPKAYRPYDTLENAMKDINRLNNKNSNYLVIVANAADKTYSKLPLPSAGKYNSIAIDVNSNTIIKVSSDITLTGDLMLTPNVTINKVDKKGNVVEMSVNVGNYDFDCSGKLSYDTTKSVSQLKNVSGKGRFAIDGNANVSGKVNVGTIRWNGDITLGEKAGFAANVQTVENSTTLKYPVAAGKNVKLGAITNAAVEEIYPGQLKVQIDGVKAGDQIAALTGDYIADTVVINGGSEFKAVRSGTKLVAVAKGTEVTVSGEKVRVYDTYENAVADITKLANADGEYTIHLPEGKYEWAKLALPANGKYKSITLVSPGKGAEISVKSDVKLTGNLVIGDGVTLQKVKTSGGDPVSPFKFTSAKNKDGSPVYTVTVFEGGKIVNGTLNGKEIVNPAEPELD
ncbi:MAG: hypothetical protein MRZ61_08710, partial [Oscillospiraceae bacterium]|nr:hypothetical protein [Oscillospiraceae bacterium]